ncbi:histidine kinase dimerization/phosphoacceptor domain -containing protein [Sulfitobacter sp. PS-8MA]|uniref:histidine kinase dimerization/phosphoacceptor domain -containing protein n=1 Tax=Sulfitobacter sp. PS-8MA TaxID=3237707 RepID=UPI0034C6627D
MTMSAQGDHMDGSNSTGCGVPRSIIFAASPHGYLILDTDFVIIDVNDRYLSMTGSQADDLVGKLLFDAFPDDPADAAADGTNNLRRSLETVVANGEPHRMAVQKYNIPIRDSATGAFEEKYWQPLNSPVFKDGKLIALIHHVEDVTSEFLGRRDQAIRLNLAKQVSGIGYGELDLLTGTANVSHELAELFGYPDTEGTMPVAKLVERVHPDDIAEVNKKLEEAMARGDAQAVVNADYRIVLPQGDIRWLNTRGKVLFEHGKPTRFIGASIDLTHSKNREEVLQRTLVERDRLLEQKETLLGDVNHRIKNSLHLVSSILRLEAASVSDKNVRDRLQQASSRVHAVSSVHELIYKSQNITRVDIGEYVPQLVDFLSTSTTSVDKKIEHIVDAEAIVLSTDMAINLALLINELVTNAHKHAFTQREQGRVHIRLHREDGQLRLIVSDDGLGEVAKPGKEGLGSKIIAGIVSQLEATMNKEATEHGYSVVIEIPLQTR